MSTNRDRIIAAILGYNLDENSRAYDFKKFRALLRSFNATFVKGIEPAFSEMFAIPELTDWQKFMKDIGYFFITTGFVRFGFWIKKTFAPTIFTVGQYHSTMHVLTVYCLWHKKKLMDKNEAINLKAELLEAIKLFKKNLSKVAKQVA